MKCKGGWRDTPDPNQININVLGGVDADADREALEPARAMTSEEFFAPLIKEFGWSHARVSSLASG